MRAGRHGNPRAGTEVPRRVLVTQLKKASRYYAAPNVRGKRFAFELSLTAKPLCKEVLCRRRGFASTASCHATCAAFRIRTRPAFFAWPSSGTRDG
jgi:hypothetical protein